jgi:P-type E1-E2 ATPase
MLKKRLALNARVLRDGKWQEKPTKELGPGDLVKLRLGEIIPADVKLIEVDCLLTDESALTGALLLAVIVTEPVATLITIYGVLLPVLGWGLALFVWGYALLLFVITDFAKVSLYKLLNHQDIKFHH